MSKFLLIRHGTTTSVDSLPGRSQGVFLSDKGKSEAAGTARMLQGSGMNRLITSPMERTIQTSKYISAELNITPEVNDHFNELDFGEWTGKNFKELDSDPRWHNFNSFRSGNGIPGGETMMEAQSRFIKGINELYNKYPEDVIGIVSHGDPIKLAVCYYLGIPVDFIFRFIIEPCSVTVIDISSAGPLFRGINLKSSFEA